MRFFALEKEDSRLTLNEGENIGVSTNFLNKKNEKVNVDLKLCANSVWLTQRFLEKPELESEKSSGYEKSSEFVLTVKKED